MTSQPPPNITISWESGFVEEIGEKTVKVNLPAAPRTLPTFSSDDISPAYRLMQEREKDDVQFARNLMGAPMGGATMAACSDNTPQQQ